MSDPFEDFDADCNCAAGPGRTPIIQAALSGFFYKYGPPPPWFSGSGWQSLNAFLVENNEGSDPPGFQFPFLYQVFPVIPFHHVPDAGLVLPFEQFPGSGAPGPLPPPPSENHGFNFEKVTLGQAFMDLVEMDPFLSLTEFTPSVHASLMLTNAGNFENPFHGIIEATFIMTGVTIARSV